jgi:hypothetical protein
MTTIATVMPIWLPQFLDDNGDPVAGGKLYSWEAGTSTPLALYTDPALTVAYSNPLILDSAGRPAGPIYLLTTPAYKFRLDDANDVVVLPTTDSIIASAPAS